MGSDLDLSQVLSFGTRIVLNIKKRSKSYAKQKKYLQHGSHLCLNTLVGLTSLRSLSSFSTSSSSSSPSTEKAVGIIHPDGQCNQQKHQGSLSKQNSLEAE